MSPDANQIPGLGLPPPTTAQSGQAGDDQTVAARTVPAHTLTDDNSNALDEEWVNKAKEIVDKTKDDPYQESRELSRVRADYLKTRYNKDIKASEDND